MNIIDLRARLDLTQTWTKNQYAKQQGGKEGGKKGLVCECQMQRSRPMEPPIMQNHYH
jgi:hypothetical protein